MQNGGGLNSGEPSQPPPRIIDTSQISLKRQKAIIKAIKEACVHSYDLLCQTLPLRGIALLSAVAGESCHT